MQPLYAPEPAVSKTQLVLRGVRDLQFLPFTQVLRVAEKANQSCSTAGVSFFTIPNSERPNFTAE
jgi:hypothetical protein